MGALCVSSPGLAFYFLHFSSNMWNQKQLSILPIKLTCIQRHAHLHDTICMDSFLLDLAEMEEHIMNCQWHESNPDCLNASHFPPAKSLLLCSFLPHTRTLLCLRDLSCTQSSLWLSLHLPSNQLPLDNHSFFTPCRLCDAQFNINHNIMRYLLLIPF